MENTASQGQETQEAKEQAFWDNIAQREAAISAGLGGKKVFPIVLCDVQEPDKYVVGFALQPDLTTRLRLIDQGGEFERGISTEACSKALEALILPGETDERISTRAGNEAYWVGACVTLSRFMTMALPVLKKKS